MPDKKTKDETHIAYAGLLAKHILRGASDDASGNFFIYFSELIAGTLEPVSMTVAEAQAAAIGGDFLAGQRVMITNPLGDTNNRFFTTARTASDLEFMGEGWFQGSAMTGQLSGVIGYDLTSDFINYFKDHKYKNEIEQYGAYNFLGLLPLDAEDTARGTTGTIAASMFNGNYIRNIIFGTDCIFEMINSRADHSSINISGNAPTDDCRVFASVFENATIDMRANAGSFTSSTIGSHAIGALFDRYTVKHNASCFNDKAEFHVGSIEYYSVSTAGLNPGYITYGVLGLLGSTFYMNGSFHAAINPDGSGNSDFTQCGWVGIAQISDTTTSGGNLNSLINHNGQKLLIYLNTGVGTPLAIADAAGNIHTPGAATITLVSGKSDWVEIGAKLEDPGQYAVQAFANYA